MTAKYQNIIDRLPNFYFFILSFKMRCCQTEFLRLYDRTQKRFCLFYKSKINKLNFNINLFRGIIIFYDDNCLDNSKIYFVYILLLLFYTDKYM